MPCMFKESWRTAAHEMVLQLDVVLSPGRRNYECFLHAKLRTLLGLFVILHYVGIAAHAYSEFYVDEATGKIRDRIGRERIFHGLNVVMKGCPWHPQVDKFDARMSFCDTDIALLQEWGMNVVRLAIMWPGVEPSRGHFNFTYLNIMKSIVEKLHVAGIYSLLEFHQDLFTAEFCGEGVPAWVLEEEKYKINVEWFGHGKQSTTMKNSRASFERKHNGIVSYLRKNNLSGYKTMNSFLPSEESIHYAETFPEPLGRRWPLDEFERESKERRPEQCSKHDWFWYYFSYAVSRAFQDLYENKWGWSDLLARYWETVANVFRNQSGVLGYELINEPWPGNFFKHPSLLLPGVADRVNLVGFYDKLQNIVRSIDQDHILFIETITFDDITCGFVTVPGGHSFRNRTVLSYHYYSPPNLGPKQAFSERVKESKKLGCGAMLTEFFVANPSKRAKGSTIGKHLQKEDLSDDLKKNIIHDRVDEVLAAADDHVQSWIGWEYKAFYNKTGSIIEQSLFNPDGEVNMALAKKLARTYPQVVCGRIVSYYFDPTTSSFTLSYFAENPSPCTTEIFVHRTFYYPFGLNVTWNPTMCISVKYKERHISLSHSSICCGLIIEVKVNKVELIEE